MKKQQPGLLYTCDLSILTNNLINMEIYIAQNPRGGGGLNNYFFSMGKKLL